LGELYPGGDTKLAVDVGEMGLHAARRDEKPCGDVVVGEPFADESDDLALGEGK
jgi:hypothetical protein